MSMKPLQARSAELFREVGSAQAATPVPPPALSKAQLLQELAPYAVSSNRQGYLAILHEVSLFLVGMALVLFAGPSWLKVIGGLIAGFKLTSFHVLAHDALHRTLVADSRMNKRIAMLLAIPAMHNYRLWVLDHLLWHHTKTNGEHVDLYRPFSKAEFDALPWWRQMVERIVRAPNVIGFAANFFFWWLLGTRVMPDRTTPVGMRPSAWRHFAALLAAHASFITFLCLAPTFAPVTLLQSLGYGLALPLFAFSFVMGTSLYVMHTHQRLPWFRGVEARTGDHAVELCASHMILPDPISKFVNNVFAHSAHHAHPGIPVYNLLAAQKHLDRLLGCRGVAEPFTLGRTLATMKACKLYDFDNHQWLDFDGKPTAKPIRLDARGA